MSDEGGTDQATGQRQRTYVYVDGFNLYYRALRGTTYKWLDLAALARSALPARAQIERINYYTAGITSKLGDNAHERQGVYLKALKTLPNLKIHRGRFLATAPFMHLYQPINFQPPPTTQPVPNPQKAKVVKFEEKGTDVTLGVHLVRDAFKGRFDQAAVLTNDTDLCEAIRIVVEDTNLPVILLCPEARPSGRLAKVSTSILTIREHIASSQFASAITTKAGAMITKPERW